MAGIEQTAFSNAFPRVKMILIFIQISLPFDPSGLIDSGNGLAPNRQAVISDWTNIVKEQWHH